MINDYYIVLVPCQVEKEGEISYGLILYRYVRMNRSIEERRFLDYQTEKSASGRVNVIHYTYDAEGRLINVKDSMGAQLEYAYNERGMRTMEKKRIAAGLWQEKQRHHQNV